MRKLYISGLAVTAGALAAVAAGAVAVTAATSAPTTPSTSATTHPHHAHHARPARLHGAVGVVSSDTNGVLVIVQPNQTKLTISLTANAKAWKYQGTGQKRTPESATALPVGEVVAVRYDPKQSVHKVRFVLDLGFNDSAAAG